MTKAWVKNKDYVVIHELDKDIQDKFCKWLFGKVCPAPADETSPCAYMNDYEQFMKLYKAGRLE